MNITVKLLLAIVLTLATAQSAAATQKWIISPYTGKQDANGNDTAMSVQASTGELVCPVVTDGVVTWELCGIPIPPSESRILAENGDYVVAESDDFILL